MVDSATNPPITRKRNRWPWIIGGVFLLLGIIGTVVAANLKADRPEYGGGTLSDYEPAGVAPLLEAPSDAKVQSDYQRQQQMLAEVGADLDRRAAELGQEIAAQGGLRSFGSGTHLVGVDIQPGTYRSDSPYCYWARLRDTTGSSDSIIANGIAEGPTTVTIAPDDNAFETNGCYWNQR